MSDPNSPGTAPYDVLVLGAGWGGLVTAALLAKKGKRVCIVEAQARAGGCGRSFNLGAFSFSAEMQYLMGCGPDGVVSEWLRALDLQEEVTFNEMDRDGYDRIELPGFSFRIPHDPLELQKALRRAFPDELQKIDAIFTVLFGIHAETDGLHFHSALLLHPFEFKDALLYGPWPAKRVFEHFGLSPKLRAVLAGQCGDIGLGPREEPFFALQAVLFGYCESAHFPKKGMGHFVEAVTSSILENQGTIFYDTAVTGLKRDGDRITCVQTTRGLFLASTVVSNIDPAVTLGMTDRAKVPKYEQSSSCFTMFLGLDIDLAQRGFGRSNIWNYPSESLDASIDRSASENLYDDPFFFLSTPSLYADPGALAPLGGTTVQVNVPSSFDFFDAANRNGTHAQEKARVAEEILTAVERRCLPEVKSHCVVHEAWSPFDLARNVGLPRGGMYGARLDFENRVLRHVRAETQFENLFLVGATTGGLGLHGAVAAGTRLVKSLLGK